MGWEPCEPHCALAVPRQLVAKKKKNRTVFKTVVFKYRKPVSESRVAQTFPGFLEFLLKITDITVVIITHHLVY